MRAKAVEMWISSTQIILLVLMATAHHRLSRCSDIGITSGAKARNPVGSSVTETEAEQWIQKTDETILKF